MSHYTHFNLSTVTQITMQQTMRTLAFICETSIFSYLGLAIFSFKHQVEPALVIWSIALCLIGRAANIFPLTWMVNKFRATKITNKMSFIMWFSGLRGAISYALSLHLEYSSEETRRVVITTTLIIVLFTTVSDFQLINFAKLIIDTSLTGVFWRIDITVAKVFAARKEEQSPLVSRSESLIAWSFWYSLATKGENSFTFEDKRVWTSNRFGAS
jgi:NhaP-type Na+/H+ and K+/H+ antiporter